MATIESADVVDALANQDSVSPDTKDIHRPSVPIPESFTGIYRNAIDYLSYGWRHKLLAEQRDHEPQCPPQLVYWSQLTAISALTGFTIGSLIRGRQTGLRFTAENWHRKPSTKRGWYLYHRNKNYNIAWGAFKGGFGHAVKFGGFLGAFFAGDICLDILRRRTDWWHGLAAGTVAGILFSIGNRLPYRMARRAVVVSGLSGLGYTATQMADFHFIRHQTLNYQTKYATVLAVHHMEKTVDE